MGRSAWVCTLRSSKHKSVSKLHRLRIPSYHFKPQMPVHGGLALSGMLTPARDLQSTYTVTQQSLGMNACVQHLLTPILLTSLKRYILLLQCPCFLDRPLQHWVLNSPVQTYCCKMRPSRSWIPDKNYTRTVDSSFDWCRNAHIITHVWSLQNSYLFPAYCKAMQGCICHALQFTTPKADTGWL